MGKFKATDIWLRLICFTIIVDSATTTVTNMVALEKLFFQILELSLECTSNAT